MIDWRELLGAILAIAVAAIGFLLVVGANNVIWPRGDCEGTYYLNPDKPFTSPVMEINERNYTKQCRTIVDVPDPTNVIGENLSGEKVYGRSELSNFGPCNDYEKCKAALDIRTFDTFGDWMRGALLWPIFLGVIIGTFFAGVAVQDHVEAHSPFVTRLRALSSLVMIVASIYYVTTYYWGLGDDGPGYAFFTGIAGFLVFLIFLFLVKDDLTSPSGSGGSALFSPRMELSAREKIENNQKTLTPERTILAQRHQTRFYAIVADHIQPAAKEATIHEYSWLDKLMLVRSDSSLKDDPAFHKFAHAVGKEFADGDNEANRKIVEALLGERYSRGAYDLFCCLLLSRYPKLVGDPDFKYRAPSMFWQRLKMPANNAESFRNSMHQLGVLAFEPDLDNVSAYIPGDCLILYGNGGTIWGVVEVSGDAVKRVDEYQALQAWTLKFKWAREVRWFNSQKETADAKEVHANLKKNGIDAPRAFSRGLTATDARKVRQLLGLADFSD